MKLKENNLWLNSCLFVDQVLSITKILINHNKISATIGAFSLGIVLAWTSPALPFLSDCNDKSSNFNPNFNNCTLSKAFTKEEGSWISSLFGIGALLSCAITGILMSKFGRKWTLIALNGPLLLGWVCLLIPAYKTDIATPYLFYVGRILTGLGTGGFATVGPVYISEVAETSIRGSIGIESLQKFAITNLSK